MQDKERKERESKHRVHREDTEGKKITGWQDGQDEKWINFSLKILSCPSCHPVFSLIPLRSVCLGALGVLIFLFMQLSQDNPRTGYFKEKKEY